MPPRIAYNGAHCVCRRLITHTSKLMEEKQDILCIKILQTLKEMMAVDPEYGEKVKKQP